MTKLLFALFAWLLRKPKKEGIFRDFEKFCRAIADKDLRAKGVTREESNAADLKLVADSAAKFLKRQHEKSKGNLIPHKNVHLKRVLQCYWSFAMHAGYAMRAIMTCVDELLAMNQGHDAADLAARGFHAINKVKISERKAFLKNFLHVVNQQKQREMNTNYLRNQTIYLFFFNNLVEAIGFENTHEDCIERWEALGKKSGLVELIRAAVYVENSSEYDSGSFKRVLFRTSGNSSFGDDSHIEREMKADDTGLVT